MDCEKCPLKQNTEDWLIFFRFVKMDKIKDYQTWKKFNEIYEFLKENK